MSQCNRLNLIQSVILSPESDTDKRTNNPPPPNRAFNIICILITKPIPFAFPFSFCWTTFLKTKWVFDKYQIDKINFILMLNGKIIISFDMPTENERKNERIIFPMKNESVITVKSKWVKNRLRQVSVFPSSFINSNGRT